MNGMNQTRTVQEARKFAKVAVLMGGQSAEREISLQSGAAVLQALRRRGVDAHGLDVGTDIVSRLIDGAYGHAFIALHGRGGEDGVIQGVLETLGLPYTGSGVLGCALSMDKLRAKWLWKGAGLPTPESVVLAGESDFEAAVQRVGMPTIIKPVNEGSSLGMTRVDDASALASAWEAARRLDSTVFAERWIDGAEYTATILGDEVLPLIRVETPRAFYDYEAKYRAADTRYVCPCGLPARVESDLKSLARRAFDVLGCRGWGRVDLICDRAQRPWLIEVNTVPGMTDHSLVPMAAEAAGVGFDDLVWRILETATDRPVAAEGGRR